MKTFQSLAVAFGLATAASAHMEMTYPPPFKGKTNPHAAGDVDYSMTNPIKGPEFPCKGYHQLFGTPAGAPTADFAPGETYNMTIAGGAAHNGGSCQASLSFDKGESWTVIHSYIGNCPVNGESSYDFTVPADTPAGEAIFAWTWFNKVGNREMYMNCAAVNIGGGGAAKRQASAAFSSRPAMFVANVDNGCNVPESIDVEFPNPGPDVTEDPAAAKGAPEGNCGSGAPSTPDEPVSQPPVVASSSAAAVPSEPGNVFVPEPTPTPSSVVVTPSAGSTLMTKTKTAVVPTPTPVKPTTPTVPSGTPVVPTPGNPTPTGGAGGFEAGSACTTEGQWNCVGGTQFQRCAAGTWSVLQGMASGLTCVPGQGDALSFQKRAPRGFWWV